MQITKTKLKAQLEVLLEKLNTGSEDIIITEDGKPKILLSGIFIP